MLKSHKTVLIFLITAATILAASTGYFYAKNLSLEKKVDDSTTKKVSNESAKTSAASTTSTTASTKTSTTSAVTTPASLTNRPSSPTDTITVAQGETLFAIGQKTGVAWTILADVNGIDANKIKAGETIIIPKNNQVAFTVNTDKAKALQEEVDAGKNPFRVIPADTAKSDSSPVYGLTTTDTFTQTKIDTTAGTAIVTATHAGKNYTINLTQPVTKGAKGIWAIVSIKAN